MRIVSLVKVEPHNQAGSQETALPTIETLKAEVLKAGFQLLTAWEDEYAIYACSSESIPGCYGHPRFEACYSKRTGWLRIGKQPPVKIANQEHLNLVALPKREKESAFIAAPDGESEWC